MSGWAGHERGALADTLAELGPDAPTLCGGWRTQELAAHLYVRERRLDAAPGVLPLGPLTSYTERVMRSVLRTLGYEEVVRRFRIVPPHLRIGGLDNAVNTVEFFVHNEDARRANGREPRDMPEGFERAVAGRLRRQARLLMRRAPARVRLVPSVGEPVEFGKGEPVEVRGRASEILLFAFNRKDAAQVDLEGTDRAVETLRAARLGI